MQCPKSICRSFDTTIKRSSTHITKPAVPKSFGQLNVKRRHRICNKCGFEFTTIEITEDAFWQFFDTASALRVVGH